jgi:hypothetical protein
MDISLLSSQDYFSDHFRVSEKTLLTCDLLDLGHIVSYLTETLSKCRFRYCRK